MHIITNSHGVEAWAETSKADLTRFDRFIDDLKSTDAPDIPKLMVVLRHVKSL